MDEKYSFKGKIESVFPLGNGKKIRVTISDEESAEFHVLSLEDNLERGMTITGSYRQSGNMKTIEDYSTCNP